MSETTNPKVARYFYLYIGGGITDLDKKSNRFVIEVEGVPDASKLLKGHVVGVAKNSFRRLHEYSDAWCNPAIDALAGLYPSFVRIPEDEVVKLFPTNCI